MTQKIEGIILQTVPYLSSAKILKVFSPDGIQSFFIKKKLPLNPFTEVEIIFYKKENGLAQVKDITIQSAHLDLRLSFDHMRAAGKMVKALLDTQMPEKPSFNLYQLFYKYLHKLPLFERPYILSDSFVLKLLRHEGLLHLCPTCNSLYTQECHHHSPYSPEDKETLFVLTYAKNFSHLKLTPPLAFSIDELYSSCL